jgi:hypothetical protein
MITLLVIAVTGCGGTSVKGSSVGIAMTSIIAETQERAGEPQPRGFGSLGALEQECKSGAKAGDLGATVLAA